MNTNVITTFAEAEQRLQREFFSRYPLASIGPLEQMETADQVEIFERQPVPAMLPVWERLSPDIGQKLLAALPAAVVTETMHGLDPTRLAHPAGGVRRRPARVPARTGRRPDREGGARGDALPAGLRRLPDGHPGAAVPHRQDRRRGACAPARGSQARTFGLLRGGLRQPPPRAGRHAGPGARRARRDRGRPRPARRGVRPADDHRRGGRGDAGGATACRTWRWSTSTAGSSA